MSVKSPILFIVFNRIDTAMQVFQAIRAYQPEHLYISSDGPRKDRDGESGIVNEIRDQLLKDIDWKCVVKTLFNEENLGCGRNVSAAISWFFENEKQGIILEDDCLPSGDFFFFCTEMLDRYKDDASIMQINGSNPYANKTASSLYIKTIYDRIWGWATWADRWKKYSYAMDGWSEYNKHKNGYISRFIWPEGWIRDMMWMRMKAELEDGAATTWDYQWSFCIMMNNGYCIQPCVNLVQNIGFASGTHYNGCCGQMKHETICCGHVTMPLTLSLEASSSHDSKEHHDYIYKKLVALINRKVFRRY
jgi:hypothetical protein